MDHPKIDHLLGGDFPSVRLVVEMDGLSCAVELALTDSSALPMIGEAYAENKDFLHEDCNAVLKGLMPEAYAQCFRLRRLFSHALGELDQVRLAAYRARVKTELDEDAGV